MKLTKQLKEEVLKTYHASWNALVRGDIKTFASLLDEQVVIYGSAAGEIFTTKKAAVKFYTATADQITGKVDLRKRKIGLKAVNNTVVVHELCDFFFLTEQGWIFYGPARITDILEKKGKAWKIIHHHTSFPDGRTIEGEQFATEKIKAENLLLRDAVQRRTVELQHKNRELEIETALEKVRSVAMGMKQAADMLSICQTISTELQKLGVKAIRNVQTAIIHKEKGTYTNYEFYTKHNKHLTTEVSYTNHAMSKAFVKKMLEGPNEFFKRSLKGKKVQEWYAFQKQSTNQFADKYLAKASSLNYYWYSLGPVALGVSTYAPLNKEEEELVVRFKNVFELAYRRYVDIKKAEAQAREAQIEAALERIRAASLAMQDSSALSEIIFKVYGELTKLDAKLDRCFIMVVHPENKGITWWMAGYEGLLAENGFFVQMNQHPTHLMYLDYCKKRKKKWTYLFEGKEKRDWDRFGFSKTELVKLPEPIKAFMSAAKKVYLSGSSDQFGSLVTGSFEPLPEEQQDIISRFTVAFNQAYIRFLDLQKAEAQAREAQIEAALERVRARTMAMQRSDELPETSHILFEKMKELGEPVEQLTIGIVNEEDKVIEISATLLGNTLKKIYNHSIDEPYMMAKVYKALKKQQKTLVVELKGDELNAYNRYRNEVTNSNMFLTNYGKEHRRIVYAAFFSKGMLALGSNEPRPLQSLQLLERFASVFDLTYTRFLDLQKAEAQAREAQIEAALEKVRSRSMAMQQPEELIEVAELLRKEMGLLGVEELETSSIYIIDNKKKKAECWYAIKDVRKENAQLISDEMTLTLTDTWVGKEMWKFYQSVNDRISILMKGERRREWINYCAQHSKVLQGYYGDEIPERTYHLVKFNGGYMGAASPGAISKESWDLLNRAAVVFSLAYTRFKDLQDAAARAREAQIELALERVRARSLAMHKSEELKEVIKVVLEQFVHLHINAEHAGFYMDYKTHDDMHIWLADPNIEPYFAIIPYFDTPTWNSFLEAKAKGTILHTDLLDFKTKNKFYKKLFKLFAIPEDAQQFYLQCKGLAVSTVLLDNVGLYIENFSAIPYTDEENNILLRFGNVFQQAYTRFLDLQKAEAQAREAQIEAALERVRSKAMAMHNSNDLPSTAIIAFSELKKLGFVPIRGGISIQNKENRKNLLYSATSSAEGDNLSLVGWAMLDNHPVLAEIYNQWMKGEDYFPELRGDLLKSYYDQVRNSFAVPLEQTEVEQFGYFMYFTHGVFYGWCAKPVLDDDKKLLRRFAAVIDLTFKRYFDLQKSEAQAREAQIEAALEKVRSRTLAMQKSDELAETAAVLFQQLIVLGIAPNRLFIILIKDDTPDMEAWLTDEDGSKVSMGFTGNYQRNTSLLKMYEGWKSKRKNLVIDMQGEELQQYFHYLHDELNVPFKGGLEQKRRVQHLAYFSHGMIGMASPDAQPNETLELLERFAAVFNLTFTRFNDLKIAEAHALQAEQDLIAIKEAKQKAEAALTELQATQKQLIQSEKMASLGELTAGIAHEIQNPLNFVNNFSEVSGELLKELVDEVEKGNTEEVKFIADDLIGNLEKINHHGKRAADIVKGMLQHSRSSSGKKEPTDINALADEYLRLAYHGLRAKDKTFNATMKTAFDESIGNINIIPQDIGRVILNLITNAFYVVNEKALSAVATPTAAKYEPTVEVNTKKEGSNVLIAVKDNGNGIPPSIKDKIFQPFFTTKPTGQGTGLGLSLSYDIVKAHSGELKVETKEYEGTTFMIMLPAS